MRNRLTLLILAIGVLYPAATRAQANASAQNPADSLGSKKEYPVMDYNGPKRFVIDDVTVTGVYVIDPISFAEGVGIFVGDTIAIPGPYITSAINKLIGRNQFSDVDIAAEMVGDDRVALDIYLESTPKVSEWRFEGIRKGQATTLSDKDHMDLKTGAASSLSQYDITKHKNYIKNYYAEKGFRNTEVDVKIENDPRYPEAGLVIVTFVIDKKDKVKIGEITFSGNEAFTDRRLRRAFKNTHQKSWNIFQGAKLKDKKYIEDRDENLIDFYNSKGYRNAHVVSDSIYNISDNRLGIHVEVSEGNQYYYRNINFMGNTIYQTDDLERVLGLSKGELYDKKTLDKRLGINKEANAEDPNTIAALYQNQGYLTSSIEPAEIIVGKDSIDLEIKIYEGKPFRVNAVEISGNEVVDDEIIRRELSTLPGELYRQDLLMASLRRLASMGHFDQTSIAPGIEPVSDQLVNISFPLTEVPSDQFEISGGWGAGMFIGSVGINLTNLSTRRLFNKGAWKPYPRGQSQVLSIRAQTNGQYYKAFSLNFMEPWMGGKKPISLNIGAHYSDETTATWLWNFSDDHFRTFGVSVGMGQRLKWPDADFTLYNELSYTMYDLKDWNYFIMRNGRSNIIALTTILGRNTIDWEIFPTKGSKFSLSLALTPPYSLFDNKDYSTASDEEKFKWVEYHKWKFAWEWYTAISSNNKLILKTAVELGYLGSYNKNKLSPFEGFDMGGSGMSGYNVYGVDIIGLRGYEDSSITPIAEYQGDYARVYNKFTVELRYPVILQPTTQIYGLVFAEAGNAYRNWKQFNPFQLKRSLGAGVRIVLPMVGMIGFDWGYGFDHPAGENKPHGGQVTFTFGNQF